MQIQFFRPRRPFLAGVQALGFIALCFSLSLPGGLAEASSLEKREGRFFAGGYVEGVEYVSDSFRGTTDAEGTFRYRDGDAVSIYLGGLFLGEAPAGPVLTPMDLMGAETLPDPAATNLCAFLMTLDENGDFADGVTISKSAAKALKNAWLDFHQAPETFALEAKTVYETVSPALGSARVATEVARETLRDSILGLVRTERDEFGVWRISGVEYPYAVQAAMGYVTAKDRLWQAELFRRSARGRLSEIFGPSQLETDVFMRALGFSEAELIQAFADLDRETRIQIWGYVNGFNRRIRETRENPTLLPFEFIALEQAMGIPTAPEYWTPTDVLSWVSAFLRSFDPEGIEYHGQLDNAALFQELWANFPQSAQTMFDDLRWLNDPEALTYVDPAFSPPRSENASPNAAAVGGGRGAADFRKAAKEVKEKRERVVEKLKDINAYVKMGSYAWAVSGKKTTSGNPVIYSGPQMGFSVPAIITECEIDAGNLQVAGMALPGVPGVMIGRTPRHAWSAQVGHAHTVDHYLEPASAAKLHRVETIGVAWGADVQLPVYRTERGPVIHPLPFSPETHDPAEPIISWKYSHWGYEAQTITGLLGFATSRSLEEFQGAAEKLGVSMHICYADREGTIAYMMTGREPVRPAGEYRLPQGFLPGVPPAEWDAAVTEPLVTDKNPRSGYYSGWNNKSHPDYPNAPNNFEYYFGPFHRAHAVDDYLASRKRLSFEELRDLALYISATDSFGEGGNPWAFASEAFGAAVQANPTAERMAAVKMLDGWDGHFVPGGPAGWVSGADLADEWLLMKTWLEEALRLTFADELGMERFAQENKTLLFNVVLHALNDEGSGIATEYDWFSNLSDPEAPQTLDAVVVAALDHALATLGERPWGAGERPYIQFVHDLLGPLHAIPYLSRSTYAQCVEMGKKGPVRVESMFPLGPSGDIRMRVDGYPEFSPYFFSMTPVFDAFAHRSFPVWGE